MARRRRSSSRYRGRSKRSYGVRRSGRQNAGRQRVVLEIHHVTPGSGGGLVATGNPAAPFAAGPAPAQPGKGKF